jgi:plastocyanin
MRRILGATAAAVVAASLLGACSSDKSTASPATTSGNTVTMQAKDYSYTPTAVQAKNGKLTFVINNSGSVEHNFTVSDLKINQDVKAGTSATVTVSAKPGTYSFHCEYHPTTMKGTITVAG